MNKIQKYLLPLSFFIYFFCSMISMAAMSIGAAQLCAIIIFTIITDSNQKNKLNNFLKSHSVQLYFFFSLLLLITIFLSLLIARNSPVSVGDYTITVNFLKDLSKVWYLFWPLVLCLGLLRLNDAQISRLQEFWIFSLCIFGSIAIYQYFTGWPREQMIIFHKPFRYQASLFIGHHLSVASLFIFPFFFSLDYLFKEKRNWKSFFIYLTPCLFGFILLFLTFSRMLWISLPIGILLWLILRLDLKKILLSLTLLFTIGLIAFQNDKVQDNLAQRGGITERIELWKANLDFYKMRPIIGVGFRKNGDLSGPYLKEKLNTDHVFAGHAHNNFLEMLASTGIVGVSVWFIWCLLPFGLLLWLKAHGHILSQGFISAWLVFQLNGLTQVNFWDGKALHQVCIMLAWTLFFTFAHGKKQKKS